MATISCPKCGLPRAEDLFGTIPCPLCGHAGVLSPAQTGEDEPDTDLPWIIPEDSAHRVAPVTAGDPLELPAPLPAKGQLVPGLLIGFLVGVAAGVGGTFGWPVVRDWLPAANPSEVAQADQSPADPPSDSSARSADPSTTPTQPDPAAGPGAPAQTTPNPPSSPGVQGPPKEAVVLGPPPEPVPLNPFRPAAPRAVRLEQADAYGPFMAPGDKVTARGRVKRLIVSGLEAGAVLDCSELDAKEVVVLGKIDGGSQLMVRAPGGRVSFHAKVDGRSRVEVRAPGGTVTFETPTDTTGEGSKIGGGARVDIKAKGVVFLGRITGTGTKVSVSLTTGGSLAFTEIDGPSRLEYGKADPDDPDPVVKRGKVGGSSVVTKVE
ncbi:MAG: hypothetical protein JWO38_7109 [Gemmataceae bacterium]|nr:hypothetical protein [Gemmataceae bacterium]